MWQHGLLSMLLTAALLQPSLASNLRGDEQDRAFEDLSMLARAGKLLTGAVTDAATALSTATPKKHPENKVEMRALLMPDVQARNLISIAECPRRCCQRVMAAVSTRLCGPRGSL